MTMSPSSSFSARPCSVASTTAAGTISQTARGRCSFFTRSSRDVAAIAPSRSTSFTDAAFRSKATHWCPALCSRRTMLAPILPSPIIPSCIDIAPVVRFFKLGDTLRQRLGNRGLQRCESSPYIFAQMHAQSASRSFGKDREIPARLRSFDDAERIFLFGNGQVIGVVARNLKEHAAVGTAFVSLSCRMQEPRTKSENSRNLLRVPDSVTNDLQSSLILPVHLDVAQESEIDPLACP